MWILGRTGRCRQSLSRASDSDMESQGGELSDAVIAAAREIGSVPLSGDRICSSWSVGLDCKVSERIDRGECKRKWRLS